MGNGSDSSVKSEFLDRGIDLAVRLAILAVVVLSCFRIFKPFLMPFVWAVIIAVALYPLFLKLKKLLGDRNRLAGGTFVVVSLALVIVPTSLLTDSLIDGTVRLGQQLEDGSFVVNPPPDRVKTWPVIGERLHDTWSAANQNLPAVIDRLEPQLRKVGSWLIHTFTDFGWAIIQTIIALIIAGVLMMNAGGGGRLANAIGNRLAGEQGVELVAMASATVQSVVKGVVLIALIQSVAAGIGMIVMQVPLAGLWSMLVLVVAVIQLPPAIILIPVIAYVFSTGDNTVANVIFTVYALIVSGADGLLKPIFLGRGVDVPMLVILIGAIGGMISVGVIGLFVGAVVLAVGYKLFESWVKDSWPGEVAAVETESDGGQ